MGAFARGDGGARGGCSGTDERRRRIVGAGPAAPNAVACARVVTGILDPDWRRAPARWRAGGGGGRARVPRVI